MREAVGSEPAAFLQERRLGSVERQSCMDIPTNDFSLAEDVAHTFGNKAPALLNSTFGSPKVPAVTPHSYQLL